jgi:CRP-like cAMP-binding protein
MSGRRFSVANFKAGGLTHMTSEIADALSSLCVTSGPHGGNPGEDKKVEATHTLQQRPLHFFQDDEQGGDQGGGDGDATPPLSESEQKEFDAIGSHIPALQDLHPHLRRLLYHRMHHLSVRGGHCVILQGELSDAWFILLRGSLQCIVSKTLAVDQCIAKAQIGSSDEADKHLAAVAASTHQFSTDSAEKKTREVVSKPGAHIPVALTLDEAKLKSDQELVGHQVHYSYENGVHVSGLVVGVFHPGDSFGESCFHFGTAMVENRIRGHKVNLHRRASFLVGGTGRTGAGGGREKEKKNPIGLGLGGARASNLSQLVHQRQGDDEEADGGPGRQGMATNAAMEYKKQKERRRASTGSMANKDEKRKAMAQFRAEKAAEKAAEALGLDAALSSSSSSSSSSSGRHPLDHELHFNAPPPPLPKQSRRAASVVALEDSQLLKVTLRDYTICKHQHRR